MKETMRGSKEQKRKKWENQKGRKKQWEDQKDERNNRRIKRMKEMGGSK